MINNNSLRLLAAMGRMLFGECEVWILHEWYRLCLCLLKKRGINIPGAGMRVSPIDGKADCFCVETVSIVDLQG